MCVAKDNIVTDRVEKRLTVLHKRHNTVTTL